jgi:hypothetical protein
MEDTKVGDRLFSYHAFFVLLDIFYIGHALALKIA